MTASHHITFSQSQEPPVCDYNNKGRLVDSFRCNILFLWTHGVPLLPANSARFSPFYFEYLLAPPPQKK
jgi:hypothetical protein